MKTIGTTTVWKWRRKSRTTPSVFATVSLCASIQKAEFGFAPSTIISAPEFRDRTALPERRLAAGDATFPFERASVFNPTYFSVFTAFRVGAISLAIPKGSDCLSCSLGPDRQPIIRGWSRNEGSRRRASPRKCLNADGMPAFSVAGARAPLMNLSGVVEEEAD
jgi:hypothetical protein